MTDDGHRRGIQEKTDVCHHLQPTLDTAQALFLL
jgi:hypothetical protein